MSYSGNSGTLTLPSPTHCSTNADFSSAARSVERIRRSLSRSPSKFQLKKSPGGGCGSPRSPLSPSPLTAGGSPSKQLGSPFLGTNTHTKSPLATPFAPSVKLSLRSAKHKTPSAHPKRTSPRSPLKRVLSESLDRANTQPQSMRTSTSFGRENLSADMANPSRRKSFEKQPQKSFFSIEIPSPTNQALAKMELDVDIYTPGPLKRTDSTMNLDTASFGSPMPKRRSMHGSANFGQDFNAFDHAPPMTSTPKFDIHEDLTENVAQAPSPIFSSTPMKFQNVNMPKRSTSLRKSTLQQRQEKSTSWNRKQAERIKAAAAAQGHSIGNGFSTPQKPKDRPRLSLDQFIEPSVERNSPFTAGHLPNPSMHMFNQPHKAHPLSRTLTQSSSSGSITDESPTHAPFHAPARIPVKFDDDTRPRLDFSKSLPAGALRPTAVDHLKLESSNEFQTPKNDYQNAKPHAAAFMSTGLVSKMRANMDEPQSAARHHLRKSIMPDTPCKKPMSGYHTIPAPGTNAMNKVKEFTRHSFGTPSIPFGSAMKPSIVSRNVFGSDFSNKGRRGSFLSIAPESHTSPENLDNLMSDNDMPPTPTKSIFNEQPGDGSPKSMRGNPFSMYSLNKSTRQSSKLSIQIATCESSESSDVEEFGDVVSPTAVSFRLSRSSMQSGMSSFGRSRARKGSNAPAPLSLGSPKHFLSPPQQGSAKIPTLTADSPQERIDFEVRHSPHTPHLGVGDLSEDASRLTVSGHGRRPLTRQNTMADFNVAKAPPATPTTGRDTVLLNGEVTPVHVPKVSDIDEHLTARFDKVEAIGGGEFSDVYRVTQMSSYFANQSCHYGGSYGGPAGSFGTPSQVVSQTPPTPRVAVFAVKKARRPFTGPSDRAKRMREVNILCDLGKSEHVIHLEDHWEIDGYLYIQTEFCEEGSLDNFLANAGRKGRLDDFRIWKIMVELGEGIKHIHKAGYIHLDLKPANVFITFEGVLKIGDFGMASSYPAPADIDGEGDREYIGPEILEGRFDKPADIFAFGLIMLEIAANVQLPDNGPSWQRLRSGDMSDVPSLTWSQGSVVRDSRGEVICDEGLMGGSDTSLELVSDDEMDCEEQLPAGSGRKRNFNPTKTRSTSHDPANLFGSVRRGERKEAPSFMVDQNHGSSIDKIVNEMICPNPTGRPTIEAIMRTEGVVWVKARRRAGATVFEGTYGPDDTVLTGSFEESGSGSGGEDAEMIDV